MHKLNELKKFILEENSLEAEKCVRDIINKSHNPSDYLDPALLYAAENNWVQGINILIGAGADIDYINKDGKSAADMAFEHSSFDVIQYLYNLNKNELKNSSLESIPHSRLPTSRTVTYNKSVSRSKSRSR